MSKDSTQESMPFNTRGGPGSTPVDPFDQEASQENREYDYPSTQESDSSTHSRGSQRSEGHDGSGKDRNQSPPFHNKKASPPSSLSRARRGNSPPYPVPTPTPLESTDSSTASSRYSQQSDKFRNAPEPAEYKSSQKVPPHMRLFPKGPAPKPKALSPPKSPENDGQTSSMPPTNTQHSYNSLFDPPRPNQTARQKAYSQAGERRLTSIPEDRQQSPPLSSQAREAAREKADQAWKSEEDKRKDEEDEEDERFNQEMEDEQKAAMATALESVPDDEPEIRRFREPTPSPSPPSKQRSKTGHPRQSKR